jgi:hypothetical protein
MATLAHSNTLVQRMLQFDGLVEITLGAFLLVGAETVADWFGVSRALVIGAGIFAFAYAAFLFYIARGEVSRRTAWVVALLNFDGALVIAIGLALAWGDLETDARWALAVAGDAVFLLSLAQMVVLRRTR